ncbi:MAG: hypothetical protein AAGA97_03620 [Pseudomonadota bacterium]
MALKHAHKLMTLYSQKLARLDKHRGKGQQRVTVEHVNVEPGGQAIVGHVDTGSTAGRAAHPTPGALDEKNPMPIKDGTATSQSKIR